MQSACNHNPCCPEFIQNIPFNSFPSSWIFLSCRPSLRMFPCYPCRPKSFALNMAFPSVRLIMVILTTTSSPNSRITANHSDAYGIHIPVSCRYGENVILVFFLCHLEESRSKRFTSCSSCLLRHLSSSPNCAG